MMYFIIGGVVFLGVLAYMCCVMSSNMDDLNPTQYDD